MDKYYMLQTLFNERNTAEGTRRIFWRSVKYFEQITQKSIIECLEIAEREEENNIRWKNCSLRKWLIKYRKWVFENYKISTARTYLTMIKTVFRHYDITIESLPYFSTKQSNQSIPINPDNLVDREILKLCIETNNPLLKAITLLMSSSGISRIDILNLTIEDYLEATSEYHNHENVWEAINDMAEIDVIPTWHLKRQKTGVQYYTFSSPESTRAINMYLLSRPDYLKKNKLLFHVNERYFNQLFKDTNDNLSLGKNGQYSRFAPHMLRRYHATQLIEAGMSEGKVDLLQGRKPQSIAYNSYIKIKPSKLKSEYVSALPFIVIEDINKVKSELDMAKEKNDVLESENSELKKQYDETNKRMDNLEKLVLGNISDDKLDRLHKLL